MISVEDRNLLHTLTEAVADDLGDLAAASALADFLEERSLATEAGRIRKLTPGDCEVLVGRFKTASQQATLDAALSRIAKTLGEWGRRVAWVNIPEGVGISILSPETEEVRTIREGLANNRSQAGAAMPQGEPRRYDDLDPDNLPMVVVCQRCGEGVPREALWQVAEERYLCAMCAWGARQEDRARRHPTEVIAT